MYNATDKAEMVNGIADVLDRERPDWYKDINLATLDMGDPHMCVLGQLYGTYASGLHSLNAQLDGIRYAVCPVGRDVDMVGGLWRDAVLARKAIDVLERDIQVQDGVRTEMIACGQGAL